MSWENDDTIVEFPSHEPENHHHGQNIPQRLNEPQQPLETPQKLAAPQMLENSVSNVKTTKQNFFDILSGKKNGITLQTNVRDYAVSFLGAKKVTNMSQAVDVIKKGIADKQAEIEQLHLKQEEMREKEKKKQREISNLLQIEKALTGGSVKNTNNHNVPRNVTHKRNRIGNNIKNRNKTHNK